MKQFFGVCESYRRSICLLVCGELSQEQQARLRSHLAVCTQCQEYHEDISEVAGTLAGWARNFEELEPGQAARERWARDFAAALVPNQRPWETRFHWFLDWCKDVIWPCRRIWTGLAAVWLILLGINLSDRHPAQTEAAKRSQPSLDMVRAYLAHEGFLGKPRGDNQNGAVERPPLPAPAPRSEQGHRSSVG